MIRSFAIAAVGALGTLSSFIAPQCTPNKPAPTVCEETVSWDGRSPIGVNRVDAWDAQWHLDNGEAVNIGWDGQDYIAGHRSSHGSVFRSGPRLDPGDKINYDCQTFVVTGRGSSYAGALFNPPVGLTIQYSGCGGVCQVYAQPA